MPGSLESFAEAQLRELEQKEGTMEWKGTNAR
jgi:hypothetical protein